MNLAELTDTLGIITGFLLTIMVVSYLIKDNVLFRLAVHIFIGVSAGYAVVMVGYNVVLYQLIVPLLQSPLNRIYLVFPPLFLGVWLLSKAFPRFSRLGGPVVAFMVGIGAATMIAGSVSGTLFPQIRASINLFDLQTARQSGTNVAFWVFNALVILVGTVTTLAYFHFGARSQREVAGQRQPWIDFLGRIGQVFIAVAFGGLFAGVYAAAVAALIERVAFVWDFIWKVIGAIL